MESIVNYFESFDLDIVAFLKANGMLIVAFLILAMLGRFAFGKKSVLCHSVSSESCNIGNAFKTGSNGGCMQQSAMQMI